MIKSMTGYGRAEGDVSGRRLAVEVKAVNHRFLNFFAKLPGDLQRFESEILGLVKGHLQRGQVSVFASWNGGTGGSAGVYVNAEAARQAAEALRHAARIAGVPGEVTLAHLLSIPGVVAPGGQGPDPDELWRETEPIFRSALVDLDLLRTKEGDHLAADTRGRLRAVSDLVDRIEVRRPLVVEELRSRLARRVEDLTKGIPVEIAAERIALELGMFADRSDVAEELVRLRSHIEKFVELLDQGGAVGRKLDFLLQELNREVNTVGSKASDAEVSRIVVEIKAELEKVREQIQNVE